VRSFGRSIEIMRLAKFRRIAFKHKSKIVQAFRDSWKGINFSQREELIVHDYIISKASGIHYLNKTVSPLLSCDGFVIKFAGVFVHQKPIVKRQNISCAPGKEKCELGDLLTLFLYLDSVRNVLFKKAFISQAKKSIGDIFLENCQTCLYEKEKEFIYARFKGLKGKRRKLPSYPRRCFALNYLILDVEQDIPNPFFVSLRHRFWCAWDLLLFNTLIGSYSLSFGFNTGYGWSKIIWDLIEVAGSSVYGKRGDRGCYLSEFLAEFNDFGDYEKAFIKSEGNGEGIPILLIIVQDKEL